QCGSFGSSQTSLARHYKLSSVKPAGIAPMRLLSSTRWPPRRKPSRERMSASGQKQTFAPRQVMSALPPKADMCGATRDVRFGPIADIRTATKWFFIRQLRWASTRRAVCICKLLNRLYAFRDVYYVHAPPEMAAGYRHAPISIHFAFGRDRTSNVRQVRRTDVAHANT